MTDAAIELDLGSPVPPSEQIRAQVADLVLTGVMGPGTRLPSVRALAADLGIAPNTVARAYGALEEAGLIQANGRRGTMVADAPPGPSDAETRQALHHAVAVARTAGWDADRIRAAVVDALG